MTGWMWAKISPSDLLSISWSCFIRFCFAFIAGHVWPCKVRVDKEECLCRNASRELSIDPKPRRQSNFQNSQKLESTTIKSVSMATSVLSMADDAFRQSENSSSEQSGIYNPHEAGGRDEMWSKSSTIFVAGTNHLGDQAIEASAAGSSGGQSSLASGARLGTGSLLQQCMASLRSKFGGSQRYD